MITLNVPEIYFVSLSENTLFAMKRSCKDGHGHYYSEVSHATYWRKSKPASSRSVVAKQLALLFLTKRTFLERGKHDIN